MYSLEFNVGNKYHSDEYEKFVDGRSETTVATTKRADNYHCNNSNTNRFSSNFNNKANCIDLKKKRREKCQVFK